MTITLNMYGSVDAMSTTYVREEFDVKVPSDGCELRQCLCTAHSSQENKIQFKYWYSIIEVWEVPEFLRILHKYDTVMLKQPVVITTE